MVAVRKASADLSKNIIPPLETTSFSCDRVLQL